MKRDKAPNFPAARLVGALGLGLLASCSQDATRMQGLCFDSLANCQAKAESAFEGTKRPVTAIVVQQGVAVYTITREKIGKNLVFDPKKTAEDAKKRGQQQQRQKQYNFGLST